MNRPSFQFYPADWRNNAKLRRCSEAARGIWMDILCVLHDSDEYGVCRWPLADLARAANAPLRLVKELAVKDVLKGADKNPEPYVYTPRHAGKSGDPISLVDVDGGPCWYSSRLVRDEWVRLRRGGSTQFTTDNQPPKVTPKRGETASPKGGIGVRQGDGPSSSSSSSTSYIGKHTHVAEEQEGRESTDARVSVPASICLAMKAKGIADVNPGHPTLLMLLEAGATLAEFEGAAVSAVAKAKGFAYALGTVKRTRQEAARDASTVHAGPMPVTTFETPYQRAAREKMTAWAPGIAARAPDAAQPVETLEASNVIAIERR